MIALNEYIKEGLLSDFDDLEASMDPIKEIKQFIKANYKTKGRLQISKKPNENGKYEISCDNVEVKNKNITSLTNNIFEWGVISGDFDCYDCKYLTSLKGAPKKVEGNFSCDWCESLKNLEGAPEEVGGSFNCISCDSLTSLKGAPKKVEGEFKCGICESLKNLEGAPEEVGGDFNCSMCKSLTSLEGAPKKVEGNFKCSYCGKKFTKEDVEKVCDVKRVINL